jgi:hypothetical protein
MPGGGDCSVCFSIQKRRLRGNGTDGAAWARVRRAAVIASLSLEAAADIEERKTPLQPLLVGTMAFKVDTTVGCPAAVGQPQVMAA